MIFVGGGAIMNDALSYSIKQGHCIDYVFSEDGETILYIADRMIPGKYSANINEEIELILACLSDGIILSVNNGQIFTQPFISIEGISIYNFHNGILPGFRGLPEICILFALLEEETEYGVSLHRVDEGIDTGVCFDINRFAIDRDDGFQEVMLKSVSACMELYKNNVHKIIEGSLVPVALEGESRLYSYKSLAAIVEYVDKPSFSRATNLGVFKLWFKGLDKAVREYRSC